MSVTLILLLSLPYLRWCEGKVGIRAVIDSWMLHVVHQTIFTAFRDDLPELISFTFFVFLELWAAKDVLYRLIAFAALLQNLIC